MSNKKITVKRRNNMKKVDTNAVGQLLKALKKPLANKAKRPPSNRSKLQRITSAVSRGGYAQNAQFSAPAAFGSRTKVSKATFGGGRTIIKHSEYISDVSGSVLFATPLTLNVNPGLPASFPWLAQIANAYEKFCIKQIQFRYAPEAPTTVTGAIFLSPEYNPQDTAPVSKSETFQNEDTVRTVPWEGVVCKIPTKYLKVYNEYFVRPGILPANQDLKTYDPLVMYVCTQGQANTNLLGEIWVDYQIELINPQGNITPVSGSAISAAGLTSAHTFNNLVQYGYLSILGTATTNVLTLSPLVIGAEYICSVVITGATLLTLVPVITSGGTQITNVSSMVNAAGSELSADVSFTATATSAVLTYTSTGTTYSEVYVWVVSVPVGGF
jgi:hypothetical protein